MRRSPGVDDIDLPEVFVVFPAPDAVENGSRSTRRDGAAFPLRPLSVFILAALARRAGWRATIIDASREALPARRPDLVMIVVWTPLAPTAYETARRFRRQGVPVVVGGVHASVVPTEALRHADAVVIGEAESILTKVLDDAAAGRLQRVYRGDWLGMDAVPGIGEYLDLYTAPAFRRVPVHSIQTSRGCRFNCSYCSVIRINGRGMRHMEPDRVLDEMRVLASIRPRLPGGTPIYILDDDLMSDREYAASMFETLVRGGFRAPLVIQASTGFGRDDEVMSLAARAGCVSVFIGFESLARESLVEANKKNRPHEYAELVRRIHDHGIGVSAGVIFGFDNDDPGVFDRTVDELERISVDSARFASLTPFPGTNVFAEMYTAGRIVDLDWGRYDAMHTVIRPEQMTTQQLQSGLAHAYRRWYSTPARVRRFGRQMRGVSWRVAAAFAASGRRYANDLDEVMDRRPMAFTPDPSDLEALLLASRAPAAETISVAVRLAHHRDDPRS